MWKTQQRLQNSTKTAKTKPGSGNRRMGPGKNWEGTGRELDGNSEGTGTGTGGNWRELAGTWRELGGNLAGTGGNLAGTGGNLAGTWRELAGTWRELAGTWRELGGNLAGTGGNSAGTWREHGGNSEGTRLKKHAIPASSCFFCCKRCCVRISPIFARVSALVALVVLCFLEGMCKSLTQPFKTSLKPWPTLRGQAKTPANSSRGSCYWLGPSVNLCVLYCPMMEYNSLPEKPQLA